MTVIGDVYKQPVVCSKENTQMLNDSKIIQSFLNLVSNGLFGRHCLEGGKCSCKWGTVS